MTKSSRSNEVSIALDVIIAFIDVIESAHGNSSMLLADIKEGKLSVLDLFDIMARNNITFKYMGSKGEIC